MNDNVPVVKVMRFGYGVRLMCPACLTISNNHYVASELREEKYLTEDAPAHLVCTHQCKSCGYSDGYGNFDGYGHYTTSCFIDGANDDREEFENLQEWEEELADLERQCANLRVKISEAQALYEKCWQTKEDYNG